MNPYVALMVLGLLALAQVTVVSSAGMAGAKPFLPLLAVVSWGLLRGPMAGLAWALALGAMLDYLSPAPFGYYTVALTAAAGVVALGHGRFYPGHLLLPGIVTVAAALAFTVVQVAPYLASWETLAWSSASLTALFAKSVALSLIWLPLVYFPLRLVAARSRGPRIDWET